MIKYSCEYTLYGDLDGMKVRDLKELLDEYPDEATIEVYEEPAYGYGGWTDEVQQYFKFTWDENN